MKRILGINGIRTDGKSSTDKLLNKLRNHDYETIDVNYPKVNIFMARSRKRQFKNAKILLEQSLPGDILIAHSYGCLLALRAMELGAEFSHVFLFAPAMNIDFTFPYLGMEKMTVIFNDRDQAIKWGEILRFRHDFGAMGRVGYKGPPDPRILNIQDHKGIKGKRNHSHYFSDENIDDWAKYIIESMGGWSGINIIKTKR